MELKRIRWALIIVGVVCLVAPPLAAQGPGVEVGAGPSAAPEGGAECVGGLIVDDGTAENGYSGNPDAVSNFQIVERLTPTSYPFLLETVCISYIQLAEDTLDGNIEIWDDDGAGGTPGTLLGSMPFSISGIPAGLPGAFFSFDVSGLGVVIDDGDVLVGTQHNPMSFPSRFVSADENGGSGSGLVNFNTGAGWQPIVDVFPGYQAMLIRAEGMMIPVELQSFDVE